MNIQATEARSVSELKTLPKLICVPTSTSVSCGGNGATVRVRASDSAKGQTITPLGFDTNKVRVIGAKTTNSGGFIDYRVRCLVNAAATTTVTFDAAGAYETASLSVTCEKKPDSLVVAEDTDIPAPFGGAGEIHGLYVRQILEARAKVKGHDGALIRHYLAQLSAASIVTDVEAEILDGLADVAMNTDAKSAAISARQVQDHLIAIDAGPQALAIGSIAVDSTCSALLASVDVAGDIVGGVVGGLVGSIFGPKGALVGAIAGAVLLSSADEAE